MSMDNNLTAELLSMLKMYCIYRLACGHLLFQFSHYRYRNN